MSSSISAPFPFPPHYNFPPFFTAQPNAQTRTSQLQHWSSLLQSYCAHHRLFSLTITPAAALSLPPFTNAKIGRKLSQKDARDIVNWMASAEGDHRAEWVRPSSSTRGRGIDTQQQAQVDTAYIYWRTPSEWGAAIQRWVDETGQKGSVLTLYELVEGEATEGQNWHGMPMGLLEKSLHTLVRQGRAAMMGSGDQAGVKFF